MIRRLAPLAIVGAATIIVPMSHSGSGRRGSVDVGIPLEAIMQRTGFIGVWNATDDGDVPPRANIKGPASGLVWPAGVAINPETAEVFTIDSVSNSLFTFTMPELFRGPSSTVNQERR